MSCREHTPGPWHLEINENSGDAEIVMGSALKDRGCYQPGHVVTLYPEMSEEYDDPNRAELLANASLMAAAPDLLTACEEIAEAMAIPRLSASYAWLELILPRLKAAIARSKGEEDPSFF